MKPLFKKIITNILIIEAQMVLKKYRPSIIAVTGSIGKTSTKDAIYAVLAERSFVRKSDKSFNSDIGVPLTILGCPNAWNDPLRWLANLFDGLLLILFTSDYPDWLVLEVGADRPGDIRNMAQWLPVDIAVITHIPEVPVHVEYFSSPEEVVEEKAALIRVLKPSGTLVLYADDPRVLALAERAKESRVITYGFAESAEVRGSGTEIAYADPATHPSCTPVGMRAQVRIKDVDGTEQSAVFVDGTLGPQAIIPFLAAAAVGMAVGTPLSDAVASFQKHHEAPRGRMRVLAGMRGSVLIDDTYNASPAPVIAALETLRELKVRGKKIAVLGDMMELGKYSATAHRKVGALAAEVADELFTVGIRMRDAAQAALDAGMSDDNIFQFERAEQVGSELARRLNDGDCVLLKGSQSVRLERTLALTLKDPLQAENLLVRQEEEWLGR